MNLSFDQIVLSKDELNFLKKLYIVDNWVVDSDLPESVEPTSLLELRLIEEQVIAGYPCYLITDFGERYFRYVSRYGKEFWKKNVWIPVAVTLLTNVLLSAAKLLLPLILQWVSSIL